MPQRSDEALLAVMASGTRAAALDALRELYERHAETVLAFVCRLEHDVNTAEDILQESFLVASRHAGRFRHGSARPWLLSIAASRLRAERRASRRRGRREAEVARPERQGGESTEAFDRELEAALERLPAKQRAVLDLRFHAGLPFQQVADVLGVSLRTAKTWSAAGLERLQRELGDGERDR